MKRHEAYPSKYLKASEVAEVEPIVVTIRSVGHDEMQDGCIKPIVHLTSFNKPCIVNATNANILYGLAGTDDDVDWPGLSVELFTAMVRAPKGETVRSICYRPALKDKKTSDPEPSKKKPVADMATALDDKIPF